jgi:hypothetical protein
MTAQIFQARILWPTLCVALLVFGVAPGALLRLIVLLYSRDNPRRRELLGELYAVPRFEQPFWVAQQFEVALFEGLADRIKCRLKSKVSDNFVGGDFRCLVCGRVLTAGNNRMIVLVNGAKKTDGARYVECPQCFSVLSVLKIAHHHGGGAAGRPVHY